jgi:hypothetical protein
MRSTIRGEEQPTSGVQPREGGSDFGGFQSRLLILWHAGDDVAPQGPSRAGGSTINSVAAVFYGAAGGCVIEAVFLFKHISAWQSARRKILVTGERKLPAITSFIDPPADAATAVTRALLGAFAGWAFHTEVTGLAAAIAVGSSAPALLIQIGHHTNLSGMVAGNQSDS